MCQDNHHVGLLGGFGPYPTLFLTEKGFYEFWNWFDSESWYPLGRIIGGTLYPGLMVTAAVVAYFFGKEIWTQELALSLLLSSLFSLATSLAPLITRPLPFSLFC
ncbi:hypothetical protein F2Q69_00030117 [Brassica cretica]|uniref:dolichyl-diphosphooligosaccharide--protein glycotransferase n=1 Tax=Brassica cretica TaxID=69181 RepID=A0A8S9S7V9_BRACR|nr:hypothetical protein F2Q69_00030117 [Brassica cretica]